MSWLKKQKQTITSRLQQHFSKVSMHAFFLSTYLSIIVSLKGRMPSLFPFSHCNTVLYTSHSSVNLLYFLLWGGQPPITPEYRRASVERGCIICLALSAAFRQLFSLGKGTVLFLDNYYKMLKPKEYIALSKSFVRRQQNTHWQCEQGNHYCHHHHTSAGTPKAQIKTEKVNCSWREIKIRRMW